MTQTFEVFLEQEIRYQDKRYLENLHRVKKIYDQHKVKNLGLEKRIEIVENISHSEAVSTKHHKREIKFVRSKHNV
jgi:hypothetical protein